MPPHIHIGVSDFQKLRREHGLYVDKTDFIIEVIKRKAEAQLYPRPRRFGKTLNMTTLHYFLERGPDRTELFSDLKVWQDAESMTHFQRHAVVFLSFKDVKPLRWAEARPKLGVVIAQAVERAEPLWRGVNLPASLRRRLEKAMDGEADESSVLRDLCHALHAATGEGVVLLIDEYDSPLLHAWTAGYYDEVAAWFRSFLGTALKDNPFLYRAVLTGILRVAKESMFSGLNNLDVYSLLARDQAEPFGFTEADVEGLLKLYDREAEAADVRQWYNGYRFGDTTVYNPWSITQFLNHPHIPPEAYWLNTSSNDMVRDLLLRSDDLQKDIVELVQGGSIDASIDENVPLRDMQGENIWSLFLFSGYLKPLAVRRDPDSHRLLTTLAIPNLEVRGLWRGTFLSWLQPERPGLDPLHRAILDGDVPTLQKLLGALVLRHVSFHDVTETQAETFYHAFVLGLLISMEKTHFVRSNREVGAGRADVQIIPKEAGKPGAILEFKKQSGKGSLFYHAGAALRQIQKQGYDAELVAAGATPIQKIGICFAGKEVVVRGA